MELSELNNLTSSGNPAEYVAKILKSFKPYFEYEAWKHYDVIFHDVMNKAKRLDKIVKRPTGDLKPDGTDIIETASIPVNRIALPFQKFIVEILATFLTGGKCDFKCSAEGQVEEAMFKAIKDIWKKNKLDFKNGTIAETMMSQTECAELWFTDYKTDPKTKKQVPVLKMNVLRPSDGFELQPFWDEIGDLIAFGVKYTKDKIQHYDLYTDEELLRHIKVKGIWQLATIPSEQEGGDPQDAVIPLKYGKMPIIYYWQQKSEWYDVQTEIERLEKMQSNHGDTNDYSGSPILFVTGDIQGFAAKGEPGKVLQGKGTATAEYLMPETAPESMKQEFDNLKAFIHLFTGAPDLSLNSLKGLGQIPSGAAFERMLILTYMKVRRRQVGDWGLTMQRRINFLISALAQTVPALADASDLDISMNWGLYQLNDLMDMINAAIAANGGLPVISQEESVGMAGLTDDSDVTWKKIQDEQGSLDNVFKNPPTPPTKKPTNPTPVETY